MRQKALFIICCLCFSILVALQVFFSFRDTGMLSYPLDDAFIHMSISKNLVEHGVWGITKFEFSSTSSSILYTLLLALGFALIGIKVWLPLLLNWIMGIAVVYVMVRISKKHMRLSEAMLLNLSFIFLVPLAGMAVLGMEHTLQILLSILFFYLTHKSWKGEKINNGIYILVAALSVLTRYEAAFLVGITAGTWLLVFRNWKQFLLLMMAIALPIIIFGMFSLSKGGFFFPNSLLAKSNFISGSVFGYFSALAGKILATGLLFSFMVFPLIYLLMYPIGGWKTFKTHPKHLAVLIFAATALSHFVLASYGWLFRYEAYLVSLLFVCIVITWEDFQQFFRWRWSTGNLALLALIAIVFFPVLSRVQMISHTKRAAKNIAEQQVQMAKFVNQHFPSFGIAMNDIGALSFYNDDMRIFDLEGLGTLEVIRQKKQFDSNFLSRYVAEHDIKIGIFYPHLYQGKIPASWQQVGTWELADNFVTAGSVVGFYAIAPQTKQKLYEDLKRYEPSLPASVKQTLDSVQFLTR